MKEKTLSNINVTDAKNQIADLQVFGDCDTWQLICKASSNAEGWMKSTKAMEIKGVGCITQVTTQQKNPDGTYLIAEALVFVPGASVATIYDSSGKITGRELVETRLTPGGI